MRARSSRRKRCLAAGTAALAALILSPPAFAQGGAANPLGPGAPGNPLSPIQPTVPQVTTTTAASNTNTSGGGLTSTDAVLIGIGALVVLGGISVFIWYDARRRAPVRQAAAATAGGPGGSRPRPKNRKLSPAERRRRKRGRAR